MDHETTARHHNQSLNQNIKLAATLLVIGGLYAVTLPTHITFEDAGLFQQVCHFGGIAHPPGYPLFTLFCTPVYALGFDPILTGNLISVFFALCTLAMLFNILRHFEVSANLSCVAIALFSVSLDFWSQAIIIEVYTLNTFLVAVLITLCLRMVDTPGPGLIFAIALASGLALSNHWPLTIASVPGLAIIVAIRWRELLAYLSRVDCLLAGIAGLTIGLLPYAYMFSRGEGVYGYSGHIANTEDFFRYISRESYAGVDQSGYSGLKDKLAFTGWFVHRLFEQFGWLFGLIGLAGLYRALQSKPVAHAGLLMVLAGNSLVLIALLGFEYTFPFQTAFSHYPLVAYLCWAIWVGIGLEWIIGLARSTKLAYRYALTLVLSVATASMLYTNYRQNDRSTDSLAEDYARLILTSLPEASVLIVDGDAPFGSIGFSRHIDNIRPDVDLYEADNVFTFKRLPEEMPDRHDYLVELSEIRPVFGIEIPWLPVRAQHGLYQSVGLPLASDRFAAEPGHLQFLQSIANQYLHGTLRVPSNLGFVHQLLIGAGHHLFSRTQTGEAQPAEIETLLVVQQTFPGAIGIVSTALATGSNTLNGAAMMSLLAPYEDNFPVSALPSEIAQYYALLAALHPDDLGISTDYLRKAYKAMPDDRNPAYCFVNPAAAGCSDP